MDVRIAGLIVAAAVGLAAGCSSSPSNTPKTDATPPPADSAPPPSSGAQGDFVCRYFDQPDLTYSTGEASATRPQLPLDWEGKRYAMQLACAVWPDANYLWLNFFGFELDDSKPQDQLYRAELVIYMRTEDYKAGELAVPARAPGWLTIAPGKNQPATTRAAVWGGKIVLSETPTQATREVKGRIEIALRAFRDQPFGSECELIAEFPKGAAPRQALLISPDCRSNDDCYPYFDGSGKGYCTRACTGDATCKAQEAESRCVKGTGSGLCLTDCTSGGAPACKALNPLLDCHSTEQVCFKP